jgi:Arc/MetJ-type ribon-helix-helix transcriptional regulator
MTIHLPDDVESSIQAAVRRGRFTSIDEAMAEAARLLLREIGEQTPESRAMNAENSPDPLLGSMADAADELDQIVADAYKRRREEPWRNSWGATFPAELAARMRSLLDTPV